MVTLKPLTVKSWFENLNKLVKKIIVNYPQRWKNKYKFPRLSAQSDFIWASILILVLRYWILQIRIQISDLHIRLGFLEKSEKKSPIYMYTLAGHEKNPLRCTVSTNQVTVNIVIPELCWLSWNMLKTLSIYSLEVWKTQKAGWKEQSSYFK